MRRYSDVTPEVGAHRTPVPERTEAAAAVSSGTSAAAGTAGRRNPQRTS